MIETSTIISSIKQHLKAANLTYKEVAQYFCVSESSIKRLLRGDNLSLKQLNKFCHLLNISMSDLIIYSEESLPKLKQLSWEQESQIIADKKLLLVALSAINQWNLRDICAMYILNEAECIKYLLQLNHMNFLILLPDNRIRLLVDHEFEWIPNGPIWKFFMQHGLSEFLEFEPNPKEHAIVFNQGILTQEAVQQLEIEMQKLRLKLTALHKESLNAPFDQRHTTSLLMIARRWEPRFLTELRRDHQA